MNVDRIMRILLIGILFAAVYTLSKPLTMTILAALAVLIVIMRVREVRDM